MHLTGISFDPMALAGCLSVTSGQTDRPHYGDDFATDNIADGFSDAA